MIYGDVWLSVKSAKEVAAEKAAEILYELLARGVQRIGVGTGSTVKLTLEKLLNDYNASSLLAKTELYASSIDTLLYLRSRGLEANTMLPGRGLQVYFDGADEVSIGGDGNCVLIKGRGAAMTREKIFAYNSEKTIIIVDETKLSKTIGDKNKPVPVEVLPEALDPVLALLNKLGVEYKVRNECLCRDGPALTDNGGIVVDVWPWKQFKIHEFESMITLVPGVLGHGIFVGYVDSIVVGYETGLAMVVECKRTKINPALKQ